MTVPASPAKDQYYGDGATAAFNITFQFQNASEVLVTILSIDGLTETTKTLSSHYDITGGGGATGQVVFRAGNIPAGTGGAGTSEKISITRNMPLSQQLDLTANDPFPAQSVELSLGDRMIMIAQQLQEQISRSAKLKLSSSLASGPLFDDPSDGKVPVYSASAGAYQNGPTATEIANAQTYSVETLGYRNDAQTAAAAATAAAAGMKFRSARAATTANITLSAAQTIDGVSVIAGERVLVKNQSAPAENGIYVVAAGAWTRSTDMDTWTEVTGSVVVVEEGSTLADTAWLCTANQGGTLGTTAINFVDWGQVILGGGIALAKLAVQAANTMVVNASGSSASPTAVAVAANQFLARSSAGNLGAKTITDFALSILDDANAAAVLTTLGVSSFMQTLLDDADAATARSTLGIVSNAITLMATQATTSGTTKDFTGIPAGTKRIKIFFVGVSQASTDQLRVQLGDSGGFETSGYSGAYYDAGSGLFTNYGAGFDVYAGGAVGVLHGVMTLDLVDAATFTWMSTHNGGRSNNVGSVYGAGSKSLSDVLTQIRVTTTAGAAFDAGLVGISYES